MVLISFFTVLKFHVVRNAEIAVPVMYLLGYIKWLMNKEQVVKTFDIPERELGVKKYLSSVYLQQYCCIGKDKAGLKPSLWASFSGL